MGRLSRTVQTVCVGLIMLTGSGCAPLLIGAGAGAIGTVVWMSGRLQTTIDTPLEQLVPATNAALRSLNIQIKKSTETKKSAQIRAQSHDDRSVHIDMSALTDASTRVAIRVGVTGNETQAQEILQAIKNNIGRPKR